MVLCTERHRNTQGGGCDMEIRMPENAKKVIETLEAAGYEAIYTTKGGKWIVTNKANVPTTSLTVEKRLQVPAGTNVGKKFPFTVTITGTAKELVGLKDAAGDGYTIWAKKNENRNAKIATPIMMQRKRFNCCFGVNGFLRRGRIISCAMILPQECM